MKHFKKLNSAGDTIIEVLIVLAVLGLAFATASATASKGLTQSRNAEEHSQALGVISSQLELLRSAVSKQADVFSFNGRPFCMSGTAPVAFPVNVTIPANSKNDILTSPTRYPAACLTTDGVYYQSITGDASGNFQIRSRWEGGGGLGKQQEIFNYRVRALAIDRDGGINVDSTPGEITVQVQPIQPANERSLADCSVTTRTGSKGGATVRLTQRNGGYAATQSTANNATSSTTFTPLIYGGRYYATVTAVPAGFTICNPSSSADYQIVTGGSSKTFGMFMNPISRVVNGSDYSSCTSGERVVGDGSDGCFRTGNSFYARRNINITYSLGATFPPGKVNLVINYNQYSAAGTRPPGNYPNFELNAKFVSATATGSAQSFTLPIASDNSSWTARTSSLISLDVPFNATSIELDWTNNPGYNDPDLQINTIQLYYK